MKVLMFGWEFPPIASGGLGTACHGLTKGLKNHNVETIFVMPKVPEGVNSAHVELISAGDVMARRKDGRETNVFAEIIPVETPITPYMTNEEYLKRLREIDLSKISKNDIVFGRSKNVNSIYGKDLFHEVWRYREIAKLIALGKNFDVIHCHDWMTYGAGIEAKKLTGKPLVLHIHATEFDRTGNNPNQHVYDLEREGFHNADKIIAVSNYTKNTVANRYGVDPSKIEVVHNAVEFNDNNYSDDNKLKDDDQIVLFLGRLTIQKGPDWFLYTAKKVADHNPNVKFVIAGSGDMEPFIINKTAELGLSDKVLFTGFLKGKEIDRAYKMADMYVMPSISEPFGITPLESMRNGTPVLISKQSGVSEVITHCLKADFWDVEEMANKIISVLQYNSLHQELKNNGLTEVKKFNWDIPAKKCVDIYHSVINDYSKKHNPNQYGGAMGGFI